MSIKSQLAKIVKTLTGSDSTAKSTAGILGEINDAVSNGSGSGGGAPLFISLTPVREEDGPVTFTTTTTAADIQNAILGGKTVWVDTTEFVLPLSMYIITNEFCVFYFILNFDDTMTTIGLQSEGDMNSPLLVSVSQSNGR